MYQHSFFATGCSSSKGYPLCIKAETPELKVYHCYDRHNYHCHDLCFQLTVTLIKLKLALNYSMSLFHMGSCDFALVGVNNFK